ncbi:MAG: isochorismatase family cysteine hydrolase [Pseudomonadota bacterium]
MVTLNDVLAASYSFVEAPPAMAQNNTALLLIDVQKLATPEHLAGKAAAAGLPADEVAAVLADYSQRFYAAVDNAATLLDAARSAEIARIHIKIEALSGNASDTGPAHRRLGWCYPPGSAETRILDAVQPDAGEIVISKTVSGAFTATNLDSVLRHTGIEWLLIAGFMTDECIEATGRAALDLGYMALFAEDAATAYEAESHDHFMAKYAGWGLTRSTADLVQVLGCLE